MSEEEKTELTEAEKAKAELRAMMEGEETPETVVEETVVEETVEETVEDETEKKPEEEDVQESTEEAEAVVETPALNDAAFARMRHEKKQAEMELKKLKEQLNPTTEPTEKVVSELVKVWESGDGDDAPLLASIRKSGSQDLQAIYDNAVAGKYGNQSDDVITMITREMPMIQNRENIAANENRTKQEALINAYNAEAEQAKVEFPQFVKEGSDEAKLFDGFKNKLLGTLDPKTGELDGLGSLPEDLSVYLQSHPYVLGQIANEALMSSNEKSDSATAKNAALTAEVASLKSQLAKYTELGNPAGGKGVDTGAKVGSAAEAKEHVKSLMV